MKNAVLVFIPIIVLLVSFGVDESLSAEQRGCITWQKNPKGEWIEVEWGNVSGVCSQGTVILETAWDENGDPIEKQRAIGNYGCPLGEFWGVTAYSNGSKGRWTGTGIGEYQCVQYVKKFQLDAMGIDIKVSIGAARNFYYSFESKNLAQFGLSLHTNGEGSLPSLGDIIVFDGGVYGHVAIVKEAIVNGDGSAIVRIIEQNWSATTCYADLKAIVEDGKYKISNRTASYSVKGWLSAKKNLTQPALYTPITFSSATVYLFANNQLWPIPNPETYCLLGFGRKNNANKPDWSYVTKLPDDRKADFSIRSVSIGRDRQTTTYRVVDRVGPNTRTARTVAANNLYQLGKDQRMHRIADWQQYLALGYDPNSRDIVDITQDLFNAYGEGAPLGKTGNSTDWKPYTYDHTTSYTGYGPVKGGLETDWQFTLLSQSNLFIEGEHVYGMFYVKDVKVKHRFRVQAYRDGASAYGYAWSWNEVGAGWNTSYFWPELSNASAGKWEFRAYLDYEHNSQTFTENLLGAVSFTVVRPKDRAPYTYDGNGHTGLGPLLGGEHTGWQYTLTEQRSNFPEGSNVIGLMYLSDIRQNFRLRTITYRNGVQQYDHVGGWVDVGAGWTRASHWPQWDNVAAGNWEFRVSVDVGNGFIDVATLPFTVVAADVTQPQTPPSQPAVPSVRFDFNGRNSDGWQPGFDAWLPPQDQADNDTWKVIAQGLSPGAVSPSLADGFSTKRTPRLRFSVKARGNARTTFGQIYIMDASGWWGYETVFTPVQVDYAYHVYEVDLSWLGDIPIRQFSIELTQDAGYEEWIFDWIELK